MKEFDQSPFVSGRYHHGFARNLADQPFGAAFHASTLIKIYRFTSELIEKKGWKNPLDLEIPNVLLLGTANVETSKSFVWFTHKKNPQSQITIADISLVPLAESVTSELCDNHRVQFAQVDARRLSDYFLPNTFHQIETDGFLKFFSDEDKAIVLQQMYEALVPGGILTTREGLTDPNADDETHYAYLNWQGHVEGYGAPVYPISRRTMWEMLGEAGFSRTMVTSDRQGFPKYIKHIVARKPLK